MADPCVRVCVCVLTVGRVTRPGGVDPGVGPTPDNRPLPP